MTVHCTCLEVFGENPDCPTHGVAAIVSQLRSPAAREHDDLSLAYYAADIIEDLQGRLSAQLSGHRLSAKQSTATIADLRANLAKAAEALEPFVAAYKQHDDPGVSDLYDEQPVAWHVPLGAYRRARSTLSAIRGDSK